MRQRQVDALEIHRSTVPFRCWREAPELKGPAAVAPVDLPPIRLEREPLGETKASIGDGL